MNVLHRDGLPVEPSHGNRGYVGHRHFWKRAALSRRQFMGTAAGVTGAVLTSGLWMPALVSADSTTAANPIPGGIQPFGPGTEVFHIVLPGRGKEPSTITDLNGFVGLANVRGLGTATNTRTGATSRLIYDVDNRFMKGTFVGTDGKHHFGAFAFI